MIRQHLFKVIVIGNCDAGKTSLVQKYTNNTFPRSYKATVGVEFALKEIKWSHDENIRVQIWDIAGQDRFTSMTRVYYKDAHGCIIMFDLTNRKSFEDTIKWKKDLDTKCSLKDDSSVPCILLGNKSDLTEQREVENQEIETLSREHKFISCKEISVKQNIQIEESIRELIKHILEKQAKLYDSSDDFDLSYENGNTWNDDTNQERSRCSC